MKVFFKFIFQEHNALWFQEVVKKKKNPEYI